MFDIFWVQLRALIWKNWIVNSKRPIVNALRCFILPVAYGIFLSFAPALFVKLHNYGMGTITPVKPLQTLFDGTLPLIWTDTTNSTSFPRPNDIISHLASNFTSIQLAAVKQVQNRSELLLACPQNYNGITPCFAAIEFVNTPSVNASDSVSGPMEYVIHADAGLGHVDVVAHTSDFEDRILPLQWAIDSAIIEVQTGVKQQTPLEWPYTRETNEEQRTELRLSYLRGVREIVGLPLFLTFVGISYHIPGSFATERVLLITEHMKAMGLLDSARIISWHISTSLMYLPMWIIISLVWHFRMFTETNTGLFVILHILLGCALASFSIVVAVPFKKSPALAAVVSTFLAIVFAIMGVILKAAPTGVLFVLSIFCPPSLYLFSLTAMTGYENHGLATNILKGDPDKGVILLPLLIASIIDIFLWPIVAVLLERRIYDARNPSKTKFWSFNSKKQPNDIPLQQADTVISVRDLTKVYQTRKFFKKKDITAISGLSLDIPKTGIFVLLGSNGAGKSTLLSTIAGISSLTSGSITFAGGAERPPRGVIGIVPQKNVLFPQLTCLQTLRVWRAVKWSKDNRGEGEVKEEDLVSLLKDCDLVEKKDEYADTLSGGQKRKLQLAIGLLGGSKIVLVDECTSGVDPLSRRALWKTLTGCREDRCIVFTTHFLDEADLLADQIGILATPGKLVANGSPVALKRDLGEGYCIQVNSSLEADNLYSEDLLTRLNMILPSAYLSSPSPRQTCYHLKTRDAGSMQQALEFFDCEVRDKKIDSYDILGTTIEEIFLDLMRKYDHPATEEGEPEALTTLSPSAHSTSISALPTGRPVPSIRQAFTIFYKRLLVFRRSWRPLYFAIQIAIIGSCLPLLFIKNMNSKTCIPTYSTVDTTSLYLPSSSFLSSPSSSVLDSPPGIIQTLGNGTNSLRVLDVPNNTTFVDTINQNYRNLSLGGISIDTTTGASLVAWEATSPGFKGASMVNLATNVLYNRALNMTANTALGPKAIRASYIPFPFVSFDRFLYMRWLYYFGLVMSVYPAFFALYVTKERRSSVQAMQFSNGLNNPVGLWLGHLMFDTIVVVFIATVIIIVFAVAASQKFVGLGYLWFILVQYGMTAALFAYCVSLVASSPLFAFAMVFVPQYIFFLLYSSAYTFVITFAAASETTRLFTIVHFATSFIFPVASVVRSAFVAANLYSILCDGTEPLDKVFLGSINRFGGPILYLFIQMFIYFAILIWADSGSRRLRETTHGHGKTSSKEDVAAAAQAVASSDDVLRVLNISKSYNGKQVLDDVSMGVSTDTVFALLGPNGAGKTTTFNIIRGDVLPDAGQVLINGTSVITNPRTARSYLGVCPQFIPIDSELTVREHLIIYGRLKGLRPGPELNNSVDVILHGTSLAGYADRLASKLSGGNQKKLSLAIALMGNPSVLLIDEFSTGVDPKMKREMWHTLKGVAKGKAVVVTTHSMEEASALANDVGILAKRMLAVGTVESLSSRYPAYEVHFSCRTREEVVKARQLMTLIPGSRMADDIATRFEVPIVPGNEFSLSNLFNTLARHGDFAEYTVEKATLESVFIKVIRENNVKEQDNERHGGRSLLRWRR